MAFNDNKAMDNQLEKVAAAVSVNSNDDLDIKKGDDREQARQFAANWVNGTDEEKKLLRKLDWRILPCTWVLYLLGYLDRSNIGSVLVILPPCTCIANNGQECENRWS